MKNLIYFIPFLFLAACGANTDFDSSQRAEIETTTVETVTPPPTDNTTENTSVENESTNLQEFNMEELYGYYVGMFNAQKVNGSKDPTWENKINISIDKISGNEIEGHSVVAGNDRPFKGSINPMKDGSLGFGVIAKEPGDDKYDGTFSFTILPEKKSIEGIWDANDKKLAVYQRDYELEKREFKYDPNQNFEDWHYTDLYGTYNDRTGESEMLTEDVAKFNPSTQELKKEDVENMKGGDLEVMRNSIYAKHGYSFKNRKMRYIFNYVDWYIPVHTDIRSELTALEKKNIDLIKRYEQHADRYYDSFGR